MLAPGDLDRDGDLDLLSATYDYLGDFYLSTWQNEEGTFTLEQQLELDYDPVDLVLGDLNGDRYLDAVLLDGKYDVVPVLFNDGAGQIIPPGSFYHSNHRAKSVALGDLDNDGDLDVVVGTSDRDGVLLNNNGTLGFYYNDYGYIRNYIGPSDQNSTYTNDIALGDVDGDGDLDVVVATGQGSNRVWLNNGTFDYTYPEEYTDPEELVFTVPQVDFLDGGTLGISRAREVQLADMDRDGDLDVVLTTSDGGEIWLNQGKDADGAWQGFALRDPTLGDSASATAVFDAEGDGDLDLLLARHGVRDELWFNHLVTQPGDITRFVDSGQNLGDTEPFAEAAALGDLDGDGDLDAFLVDSSGNRVWLSQGGNQHGDPRILVDTGQSLGGYASRDVALGDLDGDGDLDAFVANSSSRFGRANHVWINQGGAQLGPLATFADSGQLLGDSNSEAVALADVDGDGDLDAFVGNFGEPNRVWINDGYGNFTDSGQSLGGNEHVQDVVLADFDVDGDVDAFVANTFGGARSQMWVNQGRFQDGEEGTFQLLPDRDFGPLEDIAVGDFDSDGDVDAVAVVAGSKVWILVNHSSVLIGGDPNFNLSFRQSFSAYGDPRRVSVGDLDGDGDLDVLVGVHGDEDGYGGFDEGYEPHLMALVNQGGLQEGPEGSFLRARSNAALGSPFISDLQTGDIDNDGDLDAFVVSDYNEPNKVVINESIAPPDFRLQWLNGDDPSEPVGNVPVDESLGGRFTDVGLGDLDGDTYIDAFLTLDKREDQVWFNNGDGSFTDSGQALGDQSAAAVALGDLDADGDLDAFVVNNGDDPEGAYEADHVWINQGEDQGGTAGIFIDSPQRLGSDLGRDVALGDVDNDGFLDAVVAGQDGSFRGQYTAGFVDYQHDYGGYRYLTFDGGYSTDVQLGDVDRDGDLDIFVSVENDSRYADQGGNRVFLNEMVEESVHAPDATSGYSDIDELQRRFTDSTQRLGALAHVGPSGIDLGDVDADGDLDAFITSRFGSPNQLFLNQGRRLGGNFGTFEDNGQNLGSSSSSDVEFGDLDGDGDIDAFVGNLTRGNQVWLNDKVQSGITTLQSVTFGPDADGQFVYAVDPNKDAAVPCAAASQKQQQGGVVSQGAGSGTVAGSHVYADNGIYTVTVTVTDDDGAPASDTFTVTVNNVAPVVEAGADQTADEGAPIQLDPASFTDQGTADTHTATIDWGDGSSQGGLVAQGAGSGTVAGSHVYADNGSYTVTVTVTDDDGALASDTFTVTVNNVAPHRRGRRRSDRRRGSADSA